MTCVSTPRCATFVVVFTITLPILIFPTLYPWLTSLVLILGVLLVRSHLWGKVAPSPLHIPLLLLSITVIIGQLVSVDIEDTTPKAIGVALGITVVVATSRMVGGIQRKHLTLIHLVTALTMVVGGLFFTDWPAKVPVLAKALEIVPAQQVFPQLGISVHPNEFAGALLLIWPPALGIWLNRAQHYRWFAVALAFLSFILLILTQSRSGWLGSLASILLVGLLFLWDRHRESIEKFSKLNRAIVATIISATLLFIILLFDYFASAAASSMLFGSFETISFRIEVWQWALAAISDFPLYWRRFGCIS